MPLAKKDTPEDPNEYRLFAMKAPAWALWVMWFCLWIFRQGKSVAGVVLPFVPAVAWDLVPVKIIAEYFKVKFNIASMRVGGKKIRFACPFWHYWCEMYRRKFRSIGLMCGCIRKKNTGKHGSGVPMKKIWAWKEEMTMLKWIDAYIMWADEVRPEDSKIDLNQERFVVMATIPSPVWVKSEEDRCCAGCISLGTQQWKLTDYKARMTRLDGVGLSFKDPSKATLSGKWCEKGWEERMDKMLTIGPCPAVMDLEFCYENMKADGFMPKLETEKQAEMVAAKAAEMARGPPPKSYAEKRAAAQRQADAKAAAYDNEMKAAAMREADAADAIRRAARVDAAVAVGAVEVGAVEVRI